MTGRADPAVQNHARHLLPVNRGEWVIGRAQTSLRDGTARLGPSEVSSLDPDVLWAETGDRGRGRHAHGFTFFADWVGAGALLDPTEAAAMRHLILSTVLAWDERFGRDRESAPEMAYHDETTAQRLLGVIAALDLPDLDEGQRSTLTEFADRTASVLAEPDFHSGLNNHGMFQDLALLTWSVLVAPAEDHAGDVAWSLAEGRLDAYFASCFTSDGVHVENTPTYHVMVSRYLPILAGIFRHAGTSSAALYEGLLEGAERYAVHAVTPEGIYPPVSDTQRRPLDTETNLRTFIGGEFEYAATAGTRGRRPQELTAVFPRSGYAMTRSAWGDPEATFVYFSCAYNADYHKHSDELSVFLRSAGRDLLCEAGGYGYNWKDPLTKYAYSSAAHNTLLVDGKGLPRTETADVREGELAPINELRVDAAGDRLLDVTGTTRRYPGRTWTRRLEVRHGEEGRGTALRVTDRVRSAAGPAELRFLWHLGPDLVVVPRLRGAEVLADGEKVMEIEMRTTADLRIGVVTGQTKPTPQGWYFPAFGEAVPASVITVDCWQEDLDLVTEVRLNDFCWGEEDRSSLVPLVPNGPPVPAWEETSHLGDSRHAVLLLSPSPSAADRARFTAELTKNALPHWYVPGTDHLIRAGSPDAVARAANELAAAVALRARTESLDRRSLLLGAVGTAFAPAAIASLRSGIPLFLVDPALPGGPSDAVSRRLAAEIASAGTAGSPLAIRALVSGEGKDAADVALSTVDGPGLVRHDLACLLAADVEDQFSEQLRNAVAVEQGSEVRCLAGYDRRRGRFVVELPDLPSDVSVALRVFDGKTEVLSQPYAAGTSHVLEYTGRGPHRVRVHVRDAGGQEISAFTTGVVRVR